jgi:hypothetical protein
MGHTCGEPNEIELAAAHGLFYRSLGGGHRGGDSVPRSRASCNASQPCVTTGNGGNCTCPAAAAYHMLHGPAGAEWNASWGAELQAVISDTKCINGKGALPCYSQVVDNTYCKSGKFIDASGQATNAWNAVVRNNREVPCRKRP